MRELSFRVRNPEVTRGYLESVAPTAPPLRQWKYRMEFDPEWALAKPELALIERTPGIN